jgi:hypothetical protein
MAGERIRRYGWRRSARPRSWSQHLFSHSASASHSAPKTGGYRSVRAHVHALRVAEAEQEVLIANVEEREDVG